jgi:hypothetical protein
MGAIEQHPPEIRTRKVCVRQDRVLEHSVCKWKTRHIGGGEISASEIQTRMSTAIVAPFYRAMVANYKPFKILPVEMQSIAQWFTV